MNCNRINSWTPWLLVAGAILTRFAGLGDESVWLDEAASIRYAERVAELRIENGFFISRWRDPHPPVYYALLLFWMKIFGTTEAAIRSLSAVLGVVLVWLTYFSAARFIGRGVGVVAGLLVLIHPTALYYSQEARMYTLIPILILLSSTCWYCVIKTWERKYLLLYAILSVVFLYTDYLGVLLLGVHFAFGLIVIDWHRNSLDSKPIASRLVVMYLLIALAYIPWTPNLLSIPFNNIAWMREPSMMKAIVDLLHLSGLKPPTRYQPGQWLYYAVAAIVFVPGLIMSLRDRLSYRGLIASTLTVPLLMYLISVAVTPVLSGRQISVYQPVVAMVTAVGLLSWASWLQHWIGRRSLQFYALLLIIPFLVVSAHADYIHYTKRQKTDWRTIAKQTDGLLQEFPNSNVLVYPGWDVIALKYYYGDDARLHGIRKLDTLQNCLVKGNVFLIMSKRQLKMWEEVEANFQITLLRERPKHILHVQRREDGQ